MMKGVKSFNATVGQWELTLLVGPHRPFSNYPLKRDFEIELVYNGEHFLTLSDNESFIDPFYAWKRLITLSEDQLTHVYNEDQFYSLWEINTPKRMDQYLEFLLQETA